MKLISCIFYKGYFYFIAYWLSEVIRSVIGITLNNKKQYSLQYYSEGFPLEEELFKLILLNIADLLTGFLVLYTNIIMKSLKTKKKNELPKKIEKLEPSLIYNTLSYKSNNSGIWLIILISILDFGASSVYLFSTLPKIERLKPRQIDWMLSIDIIARTLLSIFLLKIQVRKHHKFSIILCMIGFILMSISDIMSIIKGNMKTKDVIIFIAIIFPKVILFPLEDVFNKIILFNEFFLPHSLIFWRGVTQFSFFLLIMPILFFNRKINWKFFKEMKSIKKIVHSVLFVVISAVKNLCLMNVIYIFNSHYISFLLVIIIFDNTIQQFFDKNSIYDLKQIKGIIYFTIDILALIIILLGTLIFNEMIIINAFGLNEKTKKGLLSIEKIDGENEESIYYSEDDDEEEDKTIKNSNNNNTIFTTPTKIVSSSNQSSNNKNINRFGTINGISAIEKNNKDDSF